MPQSKLLQVEAECCKEAGQKEAALHRVAELETLHEQVVELQAEVEDLTRQLEEASRSRCAQEEETQMLQQQVADLEAKNSGLAASCAAADEQGAILQVGPALRAAPADSEP